MNRIGIRHEDKSEWERRAPITPEDARYLVQEKGLQLTVETSTRRVFGDQAYRTAGANVSTSLADCSVIMGVKEMPLSVYEPKKAYVNFSHTIKGQPTGIPVLKRLIELGAHLIDYEKIVDDQNRRLVFFGRWAGVAGMIDSLWALGRRLQTEGINSPFQTIQPAHRYHDIVEAKAAFHAVGEAIQHEGLPVSLTPFICAFIGRGHVAQGARELYEMLSPKWIKPGELPSIKPSSNQCVGIEFHTEDVFERIGGGAFDRKEYGEHPERFKSSFASHLPELTMLINCIYWDQRYPKIVTREMLQDLYDKGSQARLRVIGDISCDIRGSMECNLRYTTPASPVYVYNPTTDEAVDGIAGVGPVILAVDALPCEMPVDASKEFSRALTPLVPALARADFSKPLNQSGLPSELQRATIVYQGRLTPPYEYLSRYLK